jgi:hypothetical protein
MQRTESMDLNSSGQEDRCLKLYLVVTRRQTAAILAYWFSDEIFFIVNNQQEADCATVIKSRLLTNECL